MNQRIKPLACVTLVIAGKTRPYPAADATIRATKTT